MTPWFDLHAAGKFLTVSLGQGGSTEKNGENGNMGLELRRSFTRREQPKARSQFWIFDGWEMWKGFVAFLVLDVD